MFYKKHALIHVGRKKKRMLSTIEAVNSVVNNFIWGVPAMICIIGVGLYLSIRTRFLQIRKFPYSMKVTLGRMMKKKKPPMEP